MDRIIVLPKELAERLHRLTRISPESNGILLYREIQGHCFVEWFLITGIGSIGNVSAYPERMTIANEFFRTHPEYKYIKYHLHTDDTISTYGEYYAKNFSSGDKEGTQEQLIHNPEFIAMLITPNRILVDAQDKPTLEVVEHSPNYEKRKEFVARELETAAKRIGVKYPRADPKKFGLRTRARRRPFEFRKRPLRSRPK